MKNVLIITLIILVISVAGCQKGSNQDNVNNGGQTKDTDLPSPSNTVNDQPSDNTVSDQKEVVINMKARKYEFEPATIKVKQGDKVKILATSEDVKHGFKIPEYDINSDIEAGRTTTIEFTADKKGEFEFSCSVFCGTGHSDMAGKLIVE